MIGSGRRDYEQARDRVIQAARCETVAEQALRQYGSGHRDCEPSRCSLTISLNIMRQQRRKAVSLLDDLVRS